MADDSTAYTATLRQIKRMEEVIMKPVTIEANEKFTGSQGIFEASGSIVMITPDVGADDYWLFRIPLENGQSIVAFPKFGTIGIGFHIEDDWNTNLPYTSGAEKIAYHIGHNRAPSSISDDDLITAIEALQKTVVKFRKG